MGSEHNKTNSLPQVSPAPAFVTYHFPARTSLPGTSLTSTAELAPSSYATALLRGTMRRAAARSPPGRPHTGSAPEAEANRDGARLAARETVPRRRGPSAMHWAEKGKSPPAALPPQPHSATAAASRNQPRRLATAITLRLRLPLGCRHAPRRGQRNPPRAGQWPLGTAHSQLAQPPPPPRSAHAQCRGRCRAGCARNAVRSGAARPGLRE